MRQIPERGFSTAEFAARTSALQRAMQAKNVDAVLLASESDIRYFTGFMTQFWQSPTRPWFVVIPREGKPVAVIPTIGVPLMEQCYVDNIHSWASPAATDDGVSLLQRVIAEMMPAQGQLGMLMGRETAFRAPLGDVLMLVDAFEGFGLVDMTTDIQHIRMIKSPAEIAKARHICGMVSDVFAKVPDFVRPGMPLSEVFRQFKIQALQAGIDDVSYLVGSAGPGGYFDIIAPPSDRPLAQGDVFMLDTGSLWDGYFSDFDRNFAVGSATDAAHKAHETLYDATEAALALCKPGSTARDLYHAMDAVLRPDAATGDDSGGDDVGRYGHGMGIQLTEPPSHTKWDDTVIEANMTLTLEPSIIYEGGFLMVAEENVLITDTGFEMLSTRCARSLPVIG